jgi:GTP-binding protein
MLIDEAHISVKAGDGGNGLVHFYSDRWRPKGGPDGGNGGDGGSVYFIGDSDIGKLHQFRHQTKFAAQNGLPGGSNQKTGKNGHDLMFQIPVGTVINYDNGTSFELTETNQKILIAKGGKGGKGNYSMRSATNQTPREFQAGQITETKNLFLQLKLIAHIGLIGLPNAGKTSLLNELTAANAKVANYPFTTLEPNLGVTKSNHIIADIPGLIEGASFGKGLGVKFLKHIERTHLLIHCLSAESQNPLRDYQIVRQELTNYSTKLAQKPEIVVITKSDLLNPKKISLITKLCHAQLAVSIIDPHSLKKLSDLISLSL